MNERLPFPQTIISSGDISATRNAWSGQRPNRHKDGGIVRLFSHGMALGGKGCVWVGGNTAWFLKQPGYFAKLPMQSCLPTSQEFPQALPRQCGGMLPVPNHWPILI